MTSATDDRYRQAGQKADELEAELKRLHRWQAEALPPEKFVEMGAFGSKTMAFEQWLQFVLLPRLRQIIDDRDKFPAQSSLAPYAVRVFDGDPDADTLHELLYQLDHLINATEAAPATSAPPSSAVSLGDHQIPEVVFQLAEVLPQFEGDDLESQLQTYDTFLSILAPSVRPAIASLLETAAQQCPNPASRQRIEQAVDDIRKGGRAAEPYDHAAAMRKYREEFRKSFPDAP